MSKPKKKQFPSMRTYKIRVRTQIKKESALIRSMNQRGMDQFVKNQSNDSPKESETKNDHR